MNCHYAPIGGDRRACTVCGHTTNQPELIRNCPGPPGDRPEDDLRRLPPLATRAQNFAEAMAAHIAAGLPVATEEEQAARIAVCKGSGENGGPCPHFLSDGAGAGYCEQCGCPMSDKRSKWISKIAWADAECPDKPPRWGPVMKSE